MSYLKHGAAIGSCSLLAALILIGAMIVVIQSAPLAPDDGPISPVHLSGFQSLCESIPKVMMYPMSWVPLQFLHIGGYGGFVLTSLFWGTLFYLVLLRILRLRSRKHPGDALHP
jgi:hypothetical protein